MLRNCITITHLILFEFLAIKSKGIQNFGNFTATNRTYCRESSPMVSKNLTTALQECEQNSNCSMFYDRCGGGKSFESCATFDLRNASSCGSILYSKGIS